MQTDLFAPENSPGEVIELTNGEYRYWPNFYDRTAADLILKKFSQNIHWKQEEMNMYGKIIKFPRLMAWYGENDKKYSFSGITLQPEPWNAELREVKNDIETFCDETFNSVLLNLYRDGNDSMSWHTDAEKELGRNPVIASVNFGAEREFQLKHRVTGEKESILLHHGSLLIMQGEIQHYWQHQIPKSKKVKSMRINLTFRTII